MNRKYEIQFNKKYIKELEKIPTRSRKQILEAVASLAFNPRPEGCKKLQGFKDPPIYRIRCGDYRVVYAIQDHIVVVLTMDVGHRKEIYRM